MATEMSWHDCLGGLVGMTGKHVLVSTGAAYGRTPIFAARFFGTLEAARPVGDEMPPLSREPDAEADLATDGLFFPVNPWPVQLPQGERPEGVGFYLAEWFFEEAEWPNEATLLIYHGGSVLMISAPESVRQGAEGGGP